MKVGDYCYIKGISRDYGIGIITKLNSGYSSNGGELIDIQFKHSKHSVPKKDVISSEKIIKLIEVGDYVNGEKVEAISISGGFVNTCDNTIYQNKIKSIVTHEEFESMEYKL